MSSSTIKEARDVRALFPDPRQASRNLSNFAWFGATPEQSELGAFFAADGPKRDPRKYCENAGHESSDGSIEYQLAFPCRAAKEAARAVFPVPARPEMSVAPKFAAERDKSSNNPGRSTSTPISGIRSFSPSKVTRPVARRAAFRIF
jgi:hypothetical protein